MNKNPEIWALVDDIAGHRNQVIGVAEALGLPYTIKKIAYNDTAKMPNILKGANLKTLDKKLSDNLSAPFPDVIISAGRKGVPIIKYIKKQAKKQERKKVFACQIMWPGFPANGLDLIAVPAHDNLPKIIKNSKKTLITHGAPNLVNSQFLQQEYKIWSRTLGDLPRPKIAVLLGGNSKKIKFSMEDANKISKQLVKMMNRLNGSVYIATSRRTEKEFGDFVFYETKRKVGLNIFYHNYNESKTKANPYYALLEAADIIIITADSISMCSEACSTGKPVFIYQPENTNSSKHKKFIEGLFKQNYASKFEDAALSKIDDAMMRNFSNANHYTNPAKKVADKIIERLG
jgi:mitochondrial fission protein ELM1